MYLLPLRSTAPQHPHLIPYDLMICKEIGNEVSHFSHRIFPVFIPIHRPLLASGERGIYRPGCLQ